MSSIDNETELTINALTQVADTLIELHRWLQSDRKPALDQVYMQRLRVQLAKTRDLVHEAWENVPPQSPQAAS
jgi:hypothetical protein